MRLNAANLSSLAPTVARPGYDRDAQQVGIVHFGIGAFHLAHQAWYADLAMEAGDRDWAIVGVSLLGGGAILIGNGGSPYYVLAGIAVPLALGLAACHKADSGSATGDTVASVAAPAGKRPEPVEPAPSVPQFSLPGLAFA